jgi:hypothetical protein
LVAVRRKVKRGTHLFSNGDRFNAIYAIRTGFLKLAWPPKTGAARSRASKWPAKSWVWTAS